MLTGDELVVWDDATWPPEEISRTNLPYAEQVWSFAVTPDGLRLGAVSLDRLLIYDLEEVAPNVALAAVADIPGARSVSASHDDVFMGIEEASIADVLARTGQVVDRRQAIVEVEAPAWHPPQRTVAGRDGDPVELLWDARYGATSFAGRARFDSRTGDASPSWSVGATEAPNRRVVLSSGRELGLDHSDTLRFEDNPAISLPLGELEDPLLAAAPDGSVVVVASKCPEVRCDSRGLRLQLVQVSDTSFTKGPAVDLPDYFHLYGVRLWADGWGVALTNVHAHLFRWSPAAGEPGPGPSFEWLEGQQPRLNFFAADRALVVTGNGLAWRLDAGGTRREIGGFRGFRADQRERSRADARLAGRHEALLVRGRAAPLGPPQPRRRHVPRGRVAAPRRTPQARARRRPGRRGAAPGREGRRPRRDRPLTRAAFEP